MISSEGSSSDLGKNVSDFKERVFEIIEELTHDIDSCSEEISKQAIEPWVYIFLKNPYLSLARFSKF